MSERREDTTALTPPVAASAHVSCPAYRLEALDTAALTFDISLSIEAARVESEMPSEEEETEELTMSLVEMFMLSLRYSVLSKE